MSNNARALTSLLSLSFAACGPAVDVGADTGDSTGPSSNSSAASTMTTSPPPSTVSGNPTEPPPPTTATTTPPPETDTWATDTFETDGSDDTGYEFIMVPDGGCLVGAPPGTMAHCSIECDPWEQDCLRGDKCSAWSSDGGDQWNSVICRPLDPMPDPVGAPCSVEGSIVSGIDTCELGAMCWNADPDTMEGACVALCTGDPDNPICGPDTTCLYANDGSLNLCVPSCDPLSDTCLEGEGCYPSGQSEGSGPFACIRTSDRIVVDDLEHTECVPGAFLATGEQSAECGEESCCTNFCALDDPLCPDTHVCEPYFPEGKGPGPASNVGFCRLAG